VGRGASSTAWLYAGSAVFHYVFRSKFLRSRSTTTEAGDARLNVRFWDFLFYASFGVVVTRSVSIAGVLLVFCYLIVPSVAAMLYADRSGRGCDRLDDGNRGLRARHLPLGEAGPADGRRMVCTFGLVLVLMAVLRRCCARRSGRRPAAARSAAAHEGVRS
jgi:zinc/manganese transport system permease protein